MEEKKSKGTIMLAGGRRTRDLVGASLVSGGGTKKGVSRVWIFFPALCDWPQGEGLGRCVAGDLPRSQALRYGKGTYGWWCFV